MNKKLITFFLLFGLFLVLNPFKMAYAMTFPPSHTTPPAYNAKKAEIGVYVEIMFDWHSSGEKYWDYYIYDLRDRNTLENTRLWNSGTDSTGSYLFPNDKPTSFSANGWFYRVNEDGSIYKIGSDNLGSSGAFTGSKLYFQGIDSSDNRYERQVISYNNLLFYNGGSGSSILDNFTPPPPSINDEKYFGYEFEYPKNKEVINLHNTSGSTYLKVPYKIKVKNFYAMPPKKVQENFTNSFKINNYKTEVNNFVWQIKSDILGMADYSIFTVEGNYYIPTSTIKDTLNAFIENPSEPWVNGQVNVNYTFDGSAPSYKPIDNNSTGEITEDGNVVIGDTDYGGIPQAPSEDGSIGDWFAYVGSLLLWLVTYPFKLLGQIVSTLTGYITNMFGILTPVTAQLNNVLSFIPSDILNVCWGFLSFTVLYSVLKSVFKMIRG